VAASWEGAVLNNLKLVAAKCDGQQQHINFCRNIDLRKRKHNKEPEEPEKRINSFGRMVPYLEWTF
jgi:hypothetical protein